MEGEPLRETDADAALLPPVGVPINSNQIPITARGEVSDESVQGTLKISIRSVGYQEDEGG